MITRHGLIPEKLPKTEEIVEEAKETARGIKVGRTLFCRKHQVSSEREFKEKVRSTGEVSVFINIGMKTWNETARALEFIYDESQKRNFRIDRFNLILDRRMGLPPKMRNSAPEETGAFLRNSAEWMNIGQVVPIQPFLGDHMIGSPASVVNTCEALRVGVNYIGNMAEFFTYSYPGWTDDISQTIETLKALVIMAAKKNDGVVVETYMEDGFSASFHDCCTILGWARLHRYIIEDLIGGETSLCHGSTYTDPLLKAAMYLALEEINLKGTPWGWIHGNTNSFSVEGDMDKNAAIVATDLLIGICLIKKKPTGAAVHPIPLTEALRVTTKEEIVQVLAMLSEVEKIAENWLEIIDWDKADKIKRKIISGGEEFFDNLIRGLDKIGFNTRDPLEILLALRRMEATEIERRFNVGEKNSSFPRQFVPVVPSCRFRRLINQRDNVLKELRVDRQERKICKKVVTATTDVHEYGITLLSSVLKELGVQIIFGGNSADPEVIAETCVKNEADAVAVSTYNGLALRYGKRLIEELRKANCNVLVFMGGRLIEDRVNELAVNVESDLRKIGIVPCKNIEEMVVSLQSR